MQANEAASDLQPTNISPVAEASASEQPVTNKKITKWLIIGLIALLLGSTSMFAYKYYEVKRQLDGKQPIDTNDLIPSSVPLSTSSPTPKRVFNEEETLAYLPKETSIYKVIKNGFNPDNSLYSINIYFPDDMVEKKDQIESDLTKNKFVGSWVIDPQKQSAKRLANWPQDYNFLKWISNEKIELHDDNESTATTYNAIIGEVVAKRVNKINFEFKSTQDGNEVEFRPIDTSLTDCFITGELVQNWIKYPFSCVEQSNITVIVPGYPEMTLKYINNHSVEIQGKIFDNLLDEQNTRWIVL